MSDDLLGMMPKRPASEPCHPAWTLTQHLMDVLLEETDISDSISFEDLEMLLWDVISQYAIVEWEDE